MHWKLPEWWHSLEGALVFLKILSSQINDASFEIQILLKPAGLGWVCVCVWGGGGGGAYAASQTSVAYEETQSNRVSDFVWSLFPKVIHFDFYDSPLDLVEFNLYHSLSGFSRRQTADIYISCKLSLRKNKCFAKISFSLLNSYFYAGFTYIIYFKRHKSVFTD